MSSDGLPSSCLPSSSSILCTIRRDSCSILPPPPLLFFIFSYQEVSLWSTTFPFVSGWIIDEAGVWKPKRLQAERLQAE